MPTDSTAQKFHTCFYEDIYMAIAERGGCIALGSLIAGNVWIALLEQSCGTALLHKS